jgi:beta-lactamase class D
MKLRILGTSIAALAFLPICRAQEKQPARPDWEHFFKEASADGTIVVADERTDGGSPGVYDEARSRKRYPPASTFKIPHAVFALDAGAVRDEFQIFKWDGTHRDIESWNHDQDLRSSMRYSVVWVYQRFAREIGIEREGQYLRKINYGNADPSGADPFWVEGNLSISAEEQIGFLRRLYRNDLPFRVEHQRLVKDIMIVEAGRDWILRAKTGWSGKIGWWIGWVEWPTGPVFFALNIDTPKRSEDLPKREALVRAILGSIKALPSSSSK